MSLGSNVRRLKGEIVRWRARWAHVGLNVLQWEHGTIPQDSFEFEERNHDQGVRFAKLSRKKMTERPMVEVLEQEFLRERALMKDLEDYLGARP